MKDLNDEEEDGQDEGQLSNIDDDVGVLSRRPVLWPSDVQYTPGTDESGLPDVRGYILDDVRSPISTPLV